MPRRRLLSGNELRDHVVALLREHEDAVRALRVTRVEGQHASIIAIRCEAFNLVLDLLKDRMAVNTLANQHLVVLVMGNHVLYDGNPANLEVYIGDGVQVDLVYVEINHELKTRSKVDETNVDDFVDTYYDDIIGGAATKHRWWLAFLLKRGDAKGNKGVACKYYMLLVEIDARRLAASGTTRQALRNEVTRLVQQAKEKLAMEDDVDQGIFFPVDNVFIVDALRDENDDLRDEVENLQEKLAERDEALAEERKRSAEMRAENEALKRKLKELEK